MASFVNANLGSDSESDDSDYNPDKDGEAEVVSEEDASGDDEDGIPAKGKKNKKKGNKKSENDFPLGKRRGGLLDWAAPGGSGENEKDSETELMKKEFDKEKEEIKQEDEKKKLDDLWADFKKDTIKPKTSAKPAGTSLGAYSIAPKNKTAKKVIAQPAKKAPSKIFSSIFDNVDQPKSEDDEKSKSVIIPPSIFSSIFEKKSNEPELSKADEKSEEKLVDDSKITITQVFDFAGEAVEVTKEVSKDSKEGQKFLKAQEDQKAAASSGEASGTQKRPAGGLSSIMGVLSNKKAKLGTLDKSKMDWNQFIEQEGIKEELQTHNKGKDGYVEKQMFLERADLRRFEIEKQSREKARKTLNK